MAWEEWDFCRSEDGLPLASRQFIDDVFFQLNFFSSVVDEYFEGRTGDGNAIKRHFNGTIKPRINVVITNSQWLAHAWPDALGSGRVIFNSRYFNCCRDIYNGDRGAYDMANRYAALLEVASVLLHELNHVVWRLGESRAWSMEGFFRNRVQAFLGIEDQALAGQITWPCGSSTNNRAGCGLADLQADMVDIMDAPDSQCST